MANAISMCVCVVSGSLSLIQAPTQCESHLLGKVINQNGSLCVCVCSSSSSSTLCVLEAKHGRVKQSFVSHSLSLSLSLFSGHRERKVQPVFCLKQKFCASRNPE